MEILKKYTYQICIGLIFILGLILRLKGYISNPSLWHDESALGWNILNKTYIELFGKLRFLQIAPPLFLTVTKLNLFIFDGYNNVYKSDLILRTFPFICGVCSMPMFYLVAKKLFNSKWTIASGLTLFAFNPILINYSFEFKPYSTDVLFSLIALYILLNIDFKTDTLKTIVKKSLILAILPWFSFASTFVIIAGIMTLSFKRTNTKLFMAILIPLILSAFLYLKIFIINSYTNNSYGMLNFWQNQFVKYDLSNLAQLNSENLNFFFINLPHFPIIILVPCIIAGFILFIKDKKYTFVIISILTYSVLISVSIMKYYPYSRRMVLFLIPLLIFYIAKITDIKKWLASWLIFILILIPHFIFAINFINSKTINKGDFARTIIQIISENTEPDEVIVISEGSNSDYFYYNYFYNLKNKIEYLKPNISKGETNSTLLNRLPKGKYWLFLSYDYNTMFENIKEITSWADENGKIIFKTQSTQSTLIKLILD